ncbi:Membralin [Eumeta japonica]|uniref:Membralin n=1 Tax=Eumeta variegata TaxID=151549 RepID=A0A4C1Z5L0_EUMVA|nr:Membralin [Eumeta japonica]
MSGGGNSGPQPLNNLPPGVNPENNVLPGGAVFNTMNRTRNNNQNPLFNVRERLFHALFFKVAVAYARTFPRPVRRFFEFLVLLKAIAAFFVLAYIHMAFSRTPTTCLNHVKDSWPRDGILRVEILRNPSQDYSIEQSYAKERKLRKEKDELNTMLGMLTTEGFINIESSSDDIEEDEYLRDGTDYGNVTRVHEDSSIEVSHEPAVEPVYADSNAGVETEEEEELEELDMNRAIAMYEELVPSTSMWDGILGLVEDIDKDTKLIDGNLDNITSNETSKDDDYILEYSLEYGFLRLSPSARLRLKIPVKIVTLDPTRDECFGDTFSRFVLDEFLGYDDLLMASIKNLAEQEDNKGYLRCPLVLIAFQGLMVEPENMDSKSVMGQCIPSLLSLLSCFVMPFGYDRFSRSDDGAEKLALEQEEASAGRERLAGGAPVRAAAGPCAPLQSGARSELQLLLFYSPFKLYCGSKFHLRGGDTFAAALQRHHAK